MVAGSRITTIERDTRETKITLDLNIDGEGKSTVSTGNGMLDHLISQISRHGLFDIVLNAEGDLDVGWHHLVEDTAICLGRAFLDAMGDRRGIHRMGHAMVPLDDSLALVAVDVSGRGYANVDCDLTGQFVETLPGEMVQHFLETFALEAKMNLHVRVITGHNSHHKAECIFKGLAKSLSHALSQNPRASSDIPSTKGVLDG